MLNYTRTGLMTVATGFMEWWTQFFFVQKRLCHTIWYGRFDSTSGKHPFGNSFIFQHISDSKHTAVNTYLISVSLFSAEILCKCIWSLCLHNRWAAIRPFLVRNALIHSFPVYIYLDKVRVSATTESVYIKAISLTRTHWVNRPQRYQKKRKSFCPLKLNLINLELLSDIDLSSGICVSLFSYIF